MFGCAMFVLTVLHATGVIEYPKLLTLYFNTVLVIGFTAISFAAVYVNWANYFWRRDTEQKHSLIPPILTTVGFFLWLFYVAASSFDRGCSQAIDVDIAKNDPGKYFYRVENSFKC